MWALAVACDALQECLGRGDECDIVAVDAARANVTALLGTVELPQWRRRVTAHVAASLKKRQSRKRSRVGCMPRTNAHTNPPTRMYIVVGSCWLGTWDACVIVVVYCPFCGCCCYRRADALKLRPWRMQTKRTLTAVAMPAWLQRTFPAVGRRPCNLQ